ncbi:aldehyde dehydrogenase family protein [Streptomyces sp. NPDC013178]|uniref:aldehyde dehydrogenase family protein n=1 Tax=Streptomyces sp. NPDC013178 TaxID=3155118 RepID=UPI0033C6A42C
MNETTMRDTTSSATPAHWIDGRPVPGSGGLIEVINPATDAVVTRVPAGVAADVDQAVDAATRAWGHWSATSPDHRAELLRAVAEGLRARSEDMAHTITAEMGAPISFSRAAQAAFPVASTEAAIAAAQQVPWTEHVGHSVVVREPIGVVGAITPWNFPLQQLVTKVVPALLAGNTVVLKPSEIAPTGARLFAEIAAEAGLPAGVLNVVHGTGPVAGEAIAGHPGIDMVSFTGSTAAGRRVAAVAAGTIKRVSLELGGKAAHILLPDADLDEAVTRVLAYAWGNAGQACGAHSRLVVPAGRHDEVVARLVAEAAEYTVGDPWDPATRLGPLASEAQRRRVEGYIRRGIADGATLAFGGPGRPQGLVSGAYVRPTVFSGVHPRSVIAQDEIFGPVLTVIPYADADEAVEIANGTVYGLNAAVTGDPEQALALARRLRVGQVDVNGAPHDFQAPFGGYKQSGNGREMGRAGIEEFLETKAITM